MSPAHNPSTEPLDSSTCALFDVPAPYLVAWALGHSLLLLDESSNWIPADEVSMNRSPWFKVGNSVVLLIHPFPQVYSVPAATPHQVLHLVHLFPSAPRVHGGHGKSDSRGIIPVLHPRVSPHSDET